MRESTVQTQTKKLEREVSVLRILINAHVREEEEIWSPLLRSAEQLYGSQAEPDSDIGKRISAAQSLGYGYDLIPEIKRVRNRGRRK